VLWTVANVVKPQRLCSTLAAPTSRFRVLHVVLRCVASKDKVTIFGGFVGKAGFVQRFVARFAVLNVSEPPAVRRGILF
jgi:hypothetical protein